MAIECFKHNIKSYDVKIGTRKSERRIKSLKRLFKKFPGHESKTF